MSAQSQDYQGYPRPPITEAIVEFRVAEPLDAADLERLNRKMRSLYPNEQTIEQFQIAVPNPYGKLHTNAPGPVPISKLYRRANNDQREIAIVSSNGLVVSQLAPYPGWPEFSGRIHRDFKAWRQEIDLRVLSRIGMRYINRIDFPFDEGGVTAGDQYVKIWVNRPEELGAISGYGITSVFNIDPGRLIVTLNSGTVPSPIPNFHSILLDIDFGAQADLPMRESELFALLDDLRRRRNEMFELCITDKARELFQ